MFGGFLDILGFFTSKLSDGPVCVFLFLKQDDVTLPNNIMIQLSAKHSRQNE